MADEQQPTVNLRILSPSSEVEGTLVFLELPASTTLQALRHRIQNTVGTRPDPERMRLIYRGRVVANGDDTLTSVFGVDNACCPLARATA